MTVEKPTVKKKKDVVLLYIEVDMAIFVYYKEIKNKMTSILLYVHTQWELYFFRNWYAERELVEKEGLVTELEHYAETSCPLGHSCSVDWEFCSCFCF